MRHAIARIVGFPTNNQAENPTSGHPTATSVQSSPSPCDLSPSDLRTATPRDAAFSDHDAPAATGAACLSAILPTARFFAGTDIVFDSSAPSAGLARPGQLVVMRTGVDDPVEVVATALSRGAAGILTEQILPGPLCQCIVPDTDRALTQIAIARSGRPDQKLVVIGIVGESGKTTTASAITTLLRDIPCRVATQTDAEISDGIVHQANPKTLPRGASMIELLCEAADAGAAVGVVELQSDVARAGGYDALTFDLLVITGRNRPKADFGPSAMRCAIERVSRRGAIVVDSQDRGTVKLARECSGAMIVTYAVDADADVSIRTHRIENDQLTGMIRHENRAAIFESTLACGTAADALAAAAAVGVITENPLVQIAESLNKVATPAGGLQRIWPDVEVSGQTPAVYLDMAGTPARAKRTLMVLRRGLARRDSSTHREEPVTLKHPALGGQPPAQTRRALAASRLWCVLTVHGDESPETLMRYGRLLETSADQCVLTCHPDAKSRFLALSHGVLDGVAACASIRLVADQARAIEWAMGAASPQDTVLVLGGSRDMAGANTVATVERLKKVVEESQLTPKPISGQATKWKIVG